MTEKIIQKHGNTRNFILNLLLLGLVGVVLIRLIAAAVYIILPVSYFIEYTDAPILITEAETCPPQIIRAETVRKIYPYLPESLAKTKRIQAKTTIELFRSDGRKIDDIQRNPSIEWKEGGINEVEWNFKTTMLPGKYYVELTTYIILPIIGEKEEPIVKRSETFTIDKCTK